MTTKTEAHRIRRKFHKLFELYNQINTHVVSALNLNCGVYVFFLKFTSVY